jgi:NAD(P)H-dependent flavin oxidoreductase YrpB (nitropropane dioxygenase family)
MAGGPSTPALAAGVNRAGGLGFLAAGYLSPDRVRQDIDALRALTDRSFGVNVFVGGGSAAGTQEIEPTRRASRPMHSGPVSPWDSPGSTTTGLTRSWPR